MKYAWIGILIAIYIIWLIATIKDMYDTFSFFKFRYAISRMEIYSYVFIIAHVMAVFLYSWGLYFGFE